MFSGYDPNAAEEHVVLPSQKTTSPTIPTYFSSAVLDLFNQSSAQKQDGSTSLVDLDVPQVSRLSVNTTPIPDSAANPTYFTDTNESVIKRVERSCRFRDLLYTLVFMGSLGIILAIFFISLIHLKASDDLTVVLTLMLLERKEYLIYFAMLTAVATVFSLMYIELVKRFTRQTVYVSLALSGLSLFAMAIYEFIKFQFRMAIWDILLGASCLLVIVQWRDRLTFTSQLLREIVPLVYKKKPLTILTAHALCVFTVIFMIFWITTTYLLAVSIYESGAPVTIWDFLTLFLYFMYFWFLRAMNGMIHLTISGGVSSWYYNDYTSSSSFMSITRANIGAFGSVCLGSLILTVLQPFRFYYCGYIMCGLQSRLEKYNKYAFVQLATTGKTYMQSCEDTDAIMKSSQMNHVLNQSVIGTAMWFSSILCGVITGAASIIIMGVYFESFNATLFWYIYIVFAQSAFMFGFGFCWMALSVVDAAASSIFVHFATQPDALEQHHPFLYELLKSKLPGGTSTREMNHFTIV